MNDQIPNDIDQSVLSITISVMENPATSCYNFYFLLHSATKTQNFLFFATNCYKIGNFSHFFDRSKISHFLLFAKEMINRQHCNPVYSN